MKRNNSSLQVTAESGVYATTELLPGGIFKTTCSIPASTLVVGNAAKAGGVKLFTFPKGVIRTYNGTVKVTMVSTEDNTEQTNALDMGAGTLIGSGANAALSGVGATAEDIFDGKTTVALTGATPITYKLAWDGELDIKDGSSTAKVFNFNFGGTFTAIETISYSGEVVVFWSLIS